MAYGYGGRRPIVMRKPAGFLEGLLGGLGVGVTQGVERALRRREIQGERKDRIVEGFLTGKFSPRAAGTDVFQRWTESSGIRKYPEIDALIQAGTQANAIEESQAIMPEEPPREPVKGMWASLADEGMGRGRTMGGPVVTIPGVTPPEVPYEYARRMQEEEDVANELAVFERHEDIRWQMKKKYEAPEMPMNQRLKMAWGDYLTALREGLPVKTISVYDPTTRTTMKLESFIEREERVIADNASLTDKGVTYLNEWKKYIGIKRGMSKAILNITNGRDIREGMEDNVVFMELLDKMYPKSLTPEEMKGMIKEFIKLGNEELMVQFEIMRARRNEFSKDIPLPPATKYGMWDVKNPMAARGEIERLATLENMLAGYTEEPEAEPTPEKKESTLRSGVVPPKEPSEEKAKTIPWQRVQWTPDGVPKGEPYLRFPGNKFQVARNGEWVWVTQKPSDY
jgi:hypothetical protein